MDKKVTIQDIADALGLSRNTVSKAINNSEGLAENTKQRILDKAVEMGYKQFSYVMAMSEVNKTKKEAESRQKKKEIAVFKTFYYNPGSHFSTLLMDKFQQEISQLGFSLVTYVISKEEIENLTLPPTFKSTETSAIVCIEVFDKAYADFVCSVGLPTLFLDGPSIGIRRGVSSDMLMMENCKEISQFIHEKAVAGMKRFGFIGDPKHCQSFYERYIAFRMSLTLEEIELHPEFLILTKDQDVHTMKEALQNLEEYPEVFICANDFIAITAMMMLREKDKRLLKQVRFLGFDDSHESRIFTPALSSVHIHTQAMAFDAVNLLMNRMKYPEMEYKTVYVATDLILRDSTEF